MKLEPRVNVLMNPGAAVCRKPTADRRPPPLQWPAGSAVAWLACPPPPPGCPLAGVERAAGAFGLATGHGRQPPPLFTADGPDLRVVPRYLERPEDAETFLFRTPPDADGDNPQAILD